MESKGSLRTVKREPLTPPVRNLIDLGSPPRGRNKTPLVQVKAEPLSDPEEESSPPLPLRDPNEPRKFQRIRQEDSSSNEDNGSDDSYVTLTPSQTSDKAKSACGKMVHKKKRLRKRRPGTAAGFGMDSESPDEASSSSSPKPKISKRISSTKAATSTSQKSCKKETRRIRTRAHSKKNKSESGSDSSLMEESSETESLNGFIAPESASESFIESMEEDKESDILIGANSQKNKRKTRSSVKRVKSGCGGGDGGKLKSAIKTPKAKAQTGKAVRRSVRFNSSQMARRKSSASEDSLFERFIPDKSESEASTNPTPDSSPQKKNDSIISSDSSESDCEIEEIDLSSSSSSSIVSNKDSPKQKKYNLRKKKGSRRDLPPSHCKKNTDSNSGSDSSASSSASPNKKEVEMDLAVEKDLRSFVDTTGFGIRRKRRRNSSGGGGPSKFVQDGPNGDEANGEASSDDSFVDNEMESAGILESSSSSDESVVEEAADVLDLNSDNFKFLPESEAEADEEEEGSEKSQSSSGEEQRGRTNFGTNGKVIMDKCALCNNLNGKLDLTGRDDFPEANKWCKCGCCKIVSPKMQNYDRICCREISGALNFMKEEMESGRCITQHPRFHKDVLDYEGYLRSMKSRLHGPNRDLNQASVHRELREFRAGTDKEKIFKCSWAFIRWIWDRLGYTNRMVIPACVMRQIRLKHAPKAGPSYFTPFKPAKTCQYAKHCKKAMIGI